jgi:hypothetical protein
MIEHRVIKRRGVGEIHYFQCDEMQISASRLGVLYGSDMQDEEWEEDPRVVLIEHGPRCTCPWCQASRKHMELRHGQ